MVYSKVYWVGRHALSENPLHDLVYKVFCHEWPDGHSSIKGATAWWNIRPIDPKPHSDLVSYCTSGGVDYTPDNPPTRTFIYYLRAPNKGGQLNIYTKPPITNMKMANREVFSWADYETDSIAPITNRLISFPIEHTHAVQPYEGNRVSIGMIFGMSCRPYINLLKILVDRQIQIITPLLIDRGRRLKIKRAIGN